MHDPVNSNLENFTYSIKTLGYFKVKNCIQGQSLLNSLALDLDSAVKHDKSIIASYDDYRFHDIVHQLLGRGDSFLELLVHPAINCCAENILSPTCIVHSFNAVKLMPVRGNNATKIHRDCPRFYTQDYPLSQQALVCIDNFSLENGSTYLLPGSHHFGERPTDEFFFENAVRVIGNPGDVVFFDSLVWHAAGQNHTECPRRGITIVWSRSFMKQQIDLVRSISREYREALPEIAKKRIGVNVQVPSNLEEFYRPRDERLYKPNQG